MTDERYLKSVLWSEALWQSNFWGHFHDSHPKTSRWATPCFRGLVGGIEGILLPLSNTIVTLVFPFFSLFKDDPEYLKGARAALSFVVAFTAMVGFFGLMFHAITSLGFLESMLGGYIMTCIVFGVAGSGHRLTDQKLSDAYVSPGELAIVF